MLATRSVKGWAEVVLRPVMRPCWQPNGQDVYTDMPYGWMPYGCHIRKYAGPQKIILIAQFALNTTRNTTRDVAIACTYPLIVS
jgi:hypothetical protein